MTADGAPDLRRPHHRRADAASCARYADAGVRNVLALRGDPPDGPGTAWVPTEGGIDYASELVELSSARPATSASASPPSRRATATRRRSTTTSPCSRPSTTPARSSRSPRWCCAPSDYFGLVERAPRAGVDFPIIPGIMPILNFSSIGQDGRAVRPRDPRRGAGPARAAQATTRPPCAPRASRIATELCDELLEGGAPGLHFYTLNRSKATREIYAALRAARRSIGLQHARVAARYLGTQAGPIACATSAADSPTEGSPAPGVACAPAHVDARRSACAGRAAGSTVLRPCQSTPYGEPPHSSHQLARATGRRGPRPGRGRGSRSRWQRGDDVLGEPPAPEDRPGVRAVRGGAVGAQHEHRVAVQHHLVRAGRAPRRRRRGGRPPAGSPASCARRAGPGPAAGAGRSRTPRLVGVDDALLGAHARRRGPPRELEVEGRGAECSTVTPRVSSRETSASASDAHPAGHRPRRRSAARRSVHMPIHAGTLRRSWPSSVIR